MKKAGRNDPCPCGSGKKFKKCCEAKMSLSHFSAAKIDLASAPQVQKATSLTSLFQSSTFAIPQKTLPSPEATAPSPSESSPEAAVDQFSSVRGMRKI